MTPHRLSCRVYRPESLPRLVLVLAASIAVFLLFNISLVLAQTEGSEEPQSCGDIITPADFYWEGEDEYRSSYYDCMNPFNTTEIIEGFFINNQAVTDGAVLVVPETGIQYYGFQGDSYRELANSALYYKQVDTDFIQQSVDFLLPTRDEIEASIARYFAGNPVLIARYTEIYFAPDQSIYFQDENYDFLIDPYTGNRTLDEYTALDQFIYSNYSWPREPLLPGRYTIVIQEFGDGGPVLGKQQSWREKIYSYVIPTVYAQEVVGAKTLTFTLVTEVPEPEGASSILFLPGIQASRLYTNDNGSENRLWEPNINADVEKLALNQNGQSINSIYTRDVLDEIYGIANVYQTFLGQLEDLKSDEKIIKNYIAFAYDWRFRVDDIAKNGTQYEAEVKSLLAEIKNLANDSYTDKVTVIAHSNGGLVGKALISELERLGEEHLVDKFVMVGTPQLGTPKAIGAIFHGMDQQAGAGYIIDDLTARAVIKNMPGAYSLLPSPRYLSLAGEAIITSDNSSETSTIREYDNIDSAEELKNFALDSLDNRDDDPTKINEPNVLNSQIFSANESLQVWLDSWQAPDTIDIYEIVGTGIPTIKSIEYRAFPCYVVICAFGSYIKPYPVFSNDGDETVMAISAGGYEGDKVMAKIDLFLEGEQFFVRQRKHSDLTESLTVQNFIDSIIRFPYLSESLVVPPDFTEVSTKYTVIGAHSPVAVVVTDDVGRQVKRNGNSVQEDIPGSQYVELGGSTYFILPEDASYNVDIRGTDVGVYSLTIDSLDGNTQSNLYTYLGASTTPNMRASFDVSTSGFSNIKTDSDGDGVFELEQNLNGEVVSPISYSYTDLRATILDLTLPKAAKNVLLVQVALAERFSKSSDTKPQHRRLELMVLSTIEDTIKLYMKKKLIPSTKVSEIQLIIDYLRE